jgi:NADH:ubiquinone oxidoreductase subunit E
MVELARVDAIIERHGARPEQVIATLLDCQEEFGYLPREVIDTVAARLGTPPTSVLGIATFFRAFSLKPVGRHQIQVCLGTTCHIQGGLRLVEALERELGIARGETTPDLQFSLKTVNCIGCCGLAPVLTVGQDVHGKLKQADIRRILRKYGRKGETHAQDHH